ncbi:hypothetical protein EMCG_03194 [[Emmonsia] crescens]|uniref:Uncharacterized protein n=1 Tax=[Emmonsia] crescens TaxID=73230 RepID=A0A0G2J0J8_9EURO|nr:hypothetical protein EMCG_03194 [Emmonsia crescens UAMH 3008]
MPQAIKFNDKAPANTPPAQTPPCNPIDENPQQSMTTGDGYKNSDAKELVDALREARADSTTSKSNPSEDTAETVLNNASKLKLQEQEISFSRNPESESPVLMDKYMSDIPPTWMECDPIFMDNENVGFDPAMKECSGMRTPKASKDNMEQPGTPVVDAAQYAWGERKPSQWLMRTAGLLKPAKKGESRRIMSGHAQLPTPLTLSRILRRVPRLRTLDPPRKSGRPDAFLSLGFMLV